MGPNVKKLITHKMSRDAIPDGGGFADGLSFLSNPERMAKAARAATEWVEHAIAIVKTAPDNPYGDDDEAIAGEILRQIDERKAKR